MMKNPHVIPRIRLIFQTKHGSKRASVFCNSTLKQANHNPCLNYPSNLIGVQLQFRFRVSLDVKISNEKQFVMQADGSLQFVELLTK